MKSIELFKEGHIRFPYRGIRKKDIQSDAEKIIRLLKLAKHSITIIITDNLTIKKINKKYRNKNRPTDVISFAECDMPFPDAGTVHHLGDVFISIERAWQQYPEYSRSFRDELRRLLVHGILHLAGYDHEKSAREEKRMKEKEEEVMGKM